MTRERRGRRTAGLSDEDVRRLAAMVGQRVIARQSDWDAIQANNALEYPDPALPTMHGAPEWVTGVLSIDSIVVPEAHIDYVRYSVGYKWDVDPRTIRPAHDADVARGKPKRPRAIARHSGLWATEAESASRVDGHDGAAC
jgi:hypothetical protein